MTRIYVSTDGNDDWSGDLPDPNDDRTDGPLRTLEAAQRAVRARRDALSEPAELEVVLRGGLYELDRPWRLTGEDSGFGRQSNRLARTWPIVWSAYEGETPVLSGGRRIDGPWRIETVNGRTAWATEPDASLLADGGFAQLWVNGQRRRRPRLPKEGFHRVERAINPDFTRHGHATSATSFGYRAGDIDPNWRNLDDVDLHFFAWWLDRWVKIRDIDTQERIVEFDRDAKLRTEWGPGDGIDYVVENIFEALTEPGEWYLDRQAGTLYYLPVDGEEPDTAEVVAPVLDSLLEVDGAAHVRLEGLTFAHNGWTLPPDLAGTKQAAIHVPAAVTLNGAEDIVLRGCTIEHLSTYGVAMHDETIEGVLDHCTLRDLGAGGVRIWNGCRRNAVLDCEIADAGVIYACAVGVLIGQSSGNRVEHCHIHDMYYTGVSVGWNWGYAESHGYGNLIEWNHIHDIGRGVLSDMGGIYLLGHAPGTRLRFNHIHDITCRRYGGWCIYTDEGSTDVLIESNLAYNANRTAFNQHYGRNNRIRNNILAYGSDAVLSYGKPEPHLGLIFERNIFLSHDTPMLKSVSPDRWTPRQTRFDGNLYWCQTGPVRFQGAAALYATQVFPDGFPAARNRLAELPDLPIVEGEPEEGDWARAATVERFVSRHGDAVAPAGAAQVRMLRRGDELLIRGVFARPRQYETPDAPLWGREHVELFLRPRPDRPPVAQFGLASDGETAAVWHDAEAEPQLDWTGEARDEGERWTALLRIPLGQVASVGDDGSPPRWGFLLGFCRPAEVADLEAWQAMGHDPSGRAADPRFVDPAGGDFRLPSDSPAFEAGFQPFDLSDVGPRPAPGAGLRQTPTTRESP